MIDPRSFSLHVAQLASARRVQNTGVGDHGAPQSEPNHDNLEMLHADDP